MSVFLIEGVSAGEFTQGTGEQIRSMIVGLMNDSGGNEIWKESSQTYAMLGGLLEALTYMRDNGKINLSVDVLRDYMLLEKVVEISNRTDIKLSMITPIKKYLLELPGYTEKDAELGQINAKAYEQHISLTLHLTEVIADLAEY